MKKTDLIIFAGTTEGRKLSEELAALGANVLLCVATDYGKELVEKCPGLQVLSGRMNASDIASLLNEYHCGLVVDATHPYAKEITKNVKAVCEEQQITYYRLVRAAFDGDSVITVDTPIDAAAFLARRSGKALLTVGSKELSAFTVVPDYQNRLYPRVLPMVESIEACMSLGFPGRQLIAMQGPFTHEMNMATLHQVHATWLVTKDSGEAGGLLEKVSAAQESGAKVILIRRPVQEEGFSYAKLRAKLVAHLGLAEPRPQYTEAFPRLPLFVDLAEKPVVVVGGGAVALRRIRVLLLCGAAITVIAPQAAAELEAMAQSDGIALYRRRYSQGDLAEAGAQLAIAATDDEAANTQVAREAARLGIPCSVADNPQAGSFWFPALMREDNLVAGLVSTNGDHRLVRQAAAEIRQLLKEIGH